MSTERKPLITRRGATFLAGTVLSLGGISSSLIGGQRWENEKAENNQNIGAIERGLELEMSRPHPDSVQKAKDLFETITKSDDYTSLDDTREVFDYSSSLVSRAAVINEGNEILKTEVEFQDKKDALVEAIGADDADDANPWTLLAGTVSAGLGIGLLGGSAVKRKK